MSSFAISLATEIGDGQMLESTTKSQQSGTLETPINFTQNDKENGAFKVPQEIPIKRSKQMMDPPLNALEDMSNFDLSEMEEMSAVLIDNIANLQSEIKSIGGLNSKQRPPTPRPQKTTSFPSPNSDSNEEFNSSSFSSALKVQEELVFSDTDPKEENVDEEKKIPLTMSRFFPNEPMTLEELEFTPSTSGAQFNILIPDHPVQLFNSQLPPNNRIYSRFRSMTKVHPCFKCRIFFDVERFNDFVDHIEDHSHSPCVCFHCGHYFDYPKMLKDHLVKVEQDRSLAKALFKSTIEYSKDWFYLYCRFSEDGAFLRMAHYVPDCPMCGVLDFASNKNKKRMPVHHSVTDYVDHCCHHVGYFRYICLLCRPDVHEEEFDFNEYRRAAITFPNHAPSVRRHIKLYHQYDYSELDADEPMFQRYMFVGMIERSFGGRVREMFDANNELESYSKVDLEGVLERDSFDAQVRMMMERDG